MPSHAHPGYEQLKKQMFPSGKMKTKTEPKGEFKQDLLTCSS